MMGSMLLFLVACSEPLSSSIPSEGEDTAADTGERNPAVQHCGAVEGDQRWEADRRHRVTCTVSVERGVLTIAAGTTVEFDAGAGLSVGTGDLEASLVVDGATAGVVFSPRTTDAWEGVTFGPNTVGASISGLAVRTTTGGVKIDGAEVFIGSLAIDGASAGCGLTLTDGARLAEGSAGLSVAGAATWSVCGEVASADSLPGQASGYTGNGTDGVYLAGTQLTASATWEDLGVPYVLADTVDVGGTAGDPAILTITEGAALEFERDKSLRFSRTGAASALRAVGTTEAPISFAALGATSAGFWRGVEVYRGTSDVQLTNVSIASSGGKTAALSVEDTPLLAQNLVIERSGTVGLKLEGESAFAEGSSGLAIRESELALVLPAAAVPTIPSAGLDFADNAVAAIQVAGVSAVAASGTWTDLGLPYWIDDDIDIDGTADRPALVTLNPGVTLLFGNNTGIFVGKKGASGLRVQGTAALPVTMEPWSANDPGAWAGVAIYDAVMDEEVVLEHLVIGYAGGSVLKGNLQVVDASPTVRAVSLHDSLEWGLYISGSGEPVVSEVTYSGNGSGECSGCP